MTIPSGAHAKADPRPPLSMERVLAAAIDLADEGGLEELSMRKLARALGIEAMSLYYYVAKKDDILDGILELVVGQMEAAATGPDWKAALRASAISAHDVLEAHPWACALMMSPARLGPARVPYMEAMLGCLRRAGFSPEQTDKAYHALDSHIIGSTLWEVGYSVGTGVELEDLAMRFRQAVPLDDYPYLAEHMDQHLKARGPDEEGSFEFGLELILDGLERMLGAR